MPLPPLNSLFCYLLLVPLCPVHQVLLRKQVETLAFLIGRKEYKEKEAQKARRSQLSRNLRQTRKTKMFIPNMTQNFESRWALQLFRQKDRLLAVLLLA
jgi:ribosomal protein S4